MLRHSSSMAQACRLETLEQRRLLSGTITPKFTPVPITSNALTADPSLSGYQSFDLQVVVTSGAEWSSGDLYATLSSGSFYVPSGHSDQAQQGQWGSNPNLQFDTFVCGPNFGSVTVLGRFKPGPVGAFISATTIDIS